MISSSLGGDRANWQQWHPSANHLGAPRAFATEKPSGKIGHSGISKACDPMRWFPDE
jgi:hypothetical protein